MPEGGVPGNREPAVVAGSCASKASKHGGYNQDYGLDAADWMFGGDGRDYMFGDRGGDHMYGGPGNDTLLGAAPATMSSA